MNESYMSLVLIMKVEEKKEGGSLTSHRETTETPLLFESLCFSDRGIATKHNRINDEAVLVSLHLLNHLGLLVGRAVVVDDTQTTLQSDGNSHFVLSDGIHGGGDKWCLEGNALGDWRLQRDFGRGEANVTWQNQEIIVCQTSVLLRIQKALDVESITLLILLEGLDRICEWQDTFWEE